ncbi:hypothetical protein HZZ13_05475 [Bradyrhizobium sp. CNPSo 4010]|uniref:Uncharacterized protein n=1 Tax=Bradyrhizobium agreste TaxID=2751811 RepID=A0ABS0PJ61_9BRAD|nr:hypothetical protein [Bradyrhizobium agreste]MBH5397243.1 hypothetical protein [Bradyrhizobium agreste]
MKQDDNPPATLAAHDFGWLLDRAGASGLDAADRAALIPGLLFMEAKIQLIRRNAAVSRSGLNESPVFE